MMIRAVQVELGPASNLTPYWKSERGTSLQLLCATISASPRYRLQGTLHVSVMGPRNVRGVVSYN